MKRRKEGFTLIELLIVMAVIAALMGALVPVAMSAIKHANATKVAENMRTILSSAQQYAYSEHDVPDTETLEASNLVTGQWATSDYSIATGTTGGVLNSNWTIPSGTASVVIRVIYNGKSSTAKELNNVWNEISKTGTPEATTTVGVYW